jgi:uncharacterized protein (DUF3820 family)
MTREEKIAVFKPQLDKFETEEMRLYCEDMIEQIPDYIFEIPSSTSGKYHNQTQCEPHGRIYHIIMFAEIMNYRLALKGNQEKFKSPIQRDAMRCTPIFHDAFKCGWEGSSFSVHDHPMIAGQWVREARVEHDIDEKVKEAIARMCERHSGEWTTSKKSKVVLPEPENAMELFVHECDYLSSRNNIDMPVPEYLNGVFVDKPIVFDENYTLPFGKHAGMRLIDVYEKIPDYVEWMEKNIHKRDILDKIKAMKEYLNNKE